MDASEGSRAAVSFVVLATGVLGAVMRGENTHTEDQACASSQMRTKGERRVSKKKRGLRELDSALVQRRENEEDAGQRREGEKGQQLQRGGSRLPEADSGKAGGEAESRMNGADTIDRKRRIPPPNSLSRPLVPPIYRQERS